LIYKSKLLATILLLAASLFPIAQCSLKAKETLQPSTEVMAVQRSGTSERIYVWRDFKVTGAACWLWISAFIWPIPLTLVRLVSRKRGVWVVLEICGCAFTTALLVSVAKDSLWRLLFGGYLAAIAIAAYIFAALLELYKHKMKA
jgi:hypothetical protein